MKALKPILAQTLVVASLMLPWATAEALEDFGVGGVISDIDISSLRLHRSDTTYRVKPSTKIIIEGVKNPGLGNLKVGDVVSLKGQKVGDINYLDRIIYQFVDNE